MPNWSKYSDDQELTPLEVNQWCHDHDFAKSHLPHGKKVTIGMLKKSQADQQNKSNEQAANRMAKASK